MNKCELIIEYDSYGGILERGSREITLDDFWSLALDKMDAYTCLKPLTVDVEAGGEESSSDDEDGEDDDDDDSDEDGGSAEGEETTVLTAPAPVEEVEEEEPEEASPHSFKSETGSPTKNPS